jgi:hypothetical protein
VASSNRHEHGSPAHPAAVVVLILIVVATLTAIVRSRPDPAAAGRDPIARVSSELTRPFPTGTALIDAVPWGRVERIESADGETLELPSPRETPLLLELPAGQWRIALSNPALDDERTCELTIAEGARESCRIEFEPVNVDQYFREAGWWR